MIGRLRHRIDNTLNSLEIIPQFLESQDPSELGENLEIAKDMLKSSALDLGHALRQMQVYLKVKEENPSHAGEYSLQAMVDKITRNFRFYEEEKEISFHVDLPEQDLCTYPRFEVEEIIFQLAHNAIHYSERSNIILRIEVGESLNIHLRDYGQGFSEAQKAYFEPQNLQNEPQKEFASGLGLKIVSTILEKLRGTMILEDELHQGSRIKVSIPLSGLPQAEKNEEEAKPKPLGKNPRILIVEDNLINALYLEGLLGDQPVDLETVSSGKDAIRFIQNDPPDLMILDIGLPDISGLDVLEYLRDENLQEEIEVVVVSAYTDPETQSKLAQFPLREVLPKPLVQEDLLDILNIEQGL
jgi:CheY-like chemotaxis protein